MGKSSTPYSLHRLVSLLLVFSALFSSASSADTMDRASSLRDNETLVSAGGRFELGFFSPARSTKRYLCIRFREGQEKPIVWVANRERPVLDGSTGVLKFGGDGNLVVFVNKEGDVVWSTAARSDGAGTNRIAQLLDWGNLVLRDADGVDVPGGIFLWQSFDEPGNTLLPGMKLLVNRKTGDRRRISSWTSEEDPSPGNFSYGLEVNKLPRLVLREGSSKIKFTTGLWNGVRFTGFPSMNANMFFNSTIVSSGDETYYTDSMINNTSLLRVLLHPTGEFERLVWTDETGAWSRKWMAPATCEQYSLCGPFGTCAEDVPFPYCRCLRGFRPKEPREWFAGNGTRGCVRETPSACGSAGDVFLPVMEVKLPELDNSSAVSMGIMSLGECRAKCARDCSCTAYAVADVRDGGKGCITWSGGLVDIRNFSTNLQQFYLRVSASDLDPSSDSNKKKSNAVAIVASMTVVSVVVIVAVLCGCWVNKRKSTKANIDKIRIQHILCHHHCNYKRKRWNDDCPDGEDSELPLFDIETITSATNNFSLGNKVGEGGFGIVYKGTLEDGQEIAVKRLSWTSVQGLTEFMNEVKLIVKLQHKNLVRLLGCCIHEDDRMLIYEYMQNKSLDFFIFDETKRGLLSWRMRLDILSGIARGLLYLHHDSRFKIIHRDLKAGNILLDGAMNPKISDFGTARIFGAEQHTESTKRVIGTHGYMSPEYAINGIISVKSDVFSFGVVILEVLSGLKSRGIYETKHMNLLSHAWKLWQEDSYLRLLDPVVTNTCPEDEVMRCMQVGLLCVQEHAGDRPTMVTVVMMLGSETVPLPRPKKPGFLMFKSLDSNEASSSSWKQEYNTNEMTISSIVGR